MTITYTGGTTGSSTLTTRTRLAVAGIGAALALALAPVAAGAPTAFAAPTATAPTAAPKIVELSGTQNTRSFANYTTEDGKSISDKVIRSDNLSGLTAADQRALQKRGVTQIVDLRTLLERTIQADKPVPGATLTEIDILGQTPITNLVNLPEAYRGFVNEPSARKGFALTLRAIKDTTAKGDAIIFHCTAGKDRTGWAAAVLLTILGVDRATVEADYLASNALRHTSADDPINGVKIEWLRASFDAADKKYGSVEGYVRDGLGLGADDVAELKANLLED